ncbi:DNA damage-regulated autophagy modulator protein 2-like [Sinocyclocheilus rhinocerous]|uniref:DNA damage-regulated autophagy modulator protein 2-like n=1 Tax=Sinocyclocheilus rhinocerous TaxID=307959 RepID=A0A673KPV3_9TELE|nr:PREDICTED: DNA damage-regulated autophagy modulator protein 2-like [Sinocyclocheilus rhinocerous]XP_016391632.1 PREDICTED: DNA damage-regulated autophagy modulator protein 2-like [Sinocyclocheilus rhinocerous]XP_016391633.1 PREDICTED: DNA damage-regulated autophagy modulator protein 2-like [Sinocyclocheilus rhinocerous]
MWWFQEGLCVLPVALVIWTAATFIFAYITAVILRHVDPLVPYISDTGTVAPERCVFGLMLNVSAFLGVATMYVRYKQLHALVDVNDTRLNCLNLMGFVLGCGSSFGMCVVANFQKTTLFAMHLVGAMLTFGVGALYILVQTLLSHRMQPHIHSKTMFWARLSVCVWTFASIISMFVSSVIMYSTLSGTEVNQKLHWTPGEPGFTPHIVSTISEWSLALSFISFFLTYIRDFKKINLRAEAQLQSEHLYDSHHSRPSETSPLLAGSI